ncbi:uncharacterized protein LOC132199160 [Neocloeon triangulifer]|uniref:uncharacterized protein LOC132199160 n=1 Tax=Neocloeon triangulifer TaxID=2078957 RepID=UPI00286F5E14|nr:uncharacterized protein LOC132199160 [Neocloeon triangulifer]
MSLKLSLTVPFASKRDAEIVYDVLRVDEEPKRGGTNKTLKLVDSTLEVCFEASETRHLRIASNSFFEHLILVQETIKTFGPAKTEKYDHW